MIKFFLMAKLSYYLNFPGTSEEAIKLYQSVIGGEILAIQRFKEMPGSEKLSAEDSNKVMHMNMKFPDGSILMASDMLESLGHKYLAGNNFYISLDCDSREECDKIFKGLSAGGKVEMELQDTFWGAYFGMWRDKFGVQWIVNYDEKGVS